MDRLAKRYGLGDVMVVRASQATVPTPLEVR